MMNIMKAKLHCLSATAASNQVIRPIKIDTFFGGQRLASRGSGFLTSEEVPSVIARGMPMELVESLSVALLSQFESLSGEGMQAVGDIYTPHCVQQ
jgi:hypothetical protein